MFSTKDIREVADYRLKICKKCPHYDTEGKDCLIPGTQPCCGICGCSMGIKAYSMSSACDDSRWPAVMSEQEEDELNEQLNNDSEE
jgi:hypothetical protein